MKKAKKLEKRIRVMEEKIDGLDAMLEKMFLCVATLQVENAHTVVPTCRAVREGWGRLLRNAQQTKKSVSEMNFRQKLQEEDAAKGEKRKPKEGFGFLAGVRTWFPIRRSLREGGARAPRSGRPARSWSSTGGRRDR